MKTFQFTYSRGTILSLNELAKAISLKATVVVENKEGIYFHGKVNAINKELAEQSLNYLMQNVYPLIVANQLIS